MTRRHPSAYSDAELCSMLRVERLTQMQRLLRVKRRERELRAAVAAAERAAAELRLRDIEAAETALDGGALRPIPRR